MENLSFGVRDAGNQKARLMEMKEDIIRLIIEETIPYFKEIFLFGSRARNNSRMDSDFDILVIVDAKGVARRHLIELGAEVRRRCAKAGIDIDIIVRDREYAMCMKDFPGNIISEALSYGVQI